MGKKPKTGTELTIPLSEPMERCPMPPTEESGASSLAYSLESPIVTLTEMRKLDSKPLDPQELDLLVQKIIDDSCGDMYKTPFSPEDNTSDHYRQRDSSVSREKVPPAISPALRPAYVAMMNFIKSPPLRFDQTKEQAERMIGQMKSLEGEIKVALYGGNYNGLSGKLGGLHKEYQTVGNQRFECARGIQELGKEIGQVHQQIKSTEEALRTETDQDNIREYQEQLISFRFYLDQYEGIKQDLEIKLVETHRQVKSRGREIEKAEQIRTYIREVITPMRPCTGEGNYPFGRDRGVKDYSRIGDELQSLVPKLQQQLQQLSKYICSMESKDSAPDSAPNPEQQLAKYRGLIEAIEARDMQMKQSGSGENNSGGILTK